MPASRWISLQLHLQLLAQLQIQCAERLVEQQHGRPIHERARERHPLLLATGELGGPALRLRREAHSLELLRHAPPRLGPVDLLALEAEGDVLLHVKVREEGVALEHGVGRALERGTARYVLAVEEHAALAGFLEAGDHAERGRLAAAGRAEHREELAARNVQAHVPHRGELAEALRHPLQADAGRTPLALMAHPRRQLMSDTERSQGAKSRKHAVLIGRSVERMGRMFLRDAPLCLSRNADTVGRSV